MAKYLAEDADIVLSPAFETGVVNIIKGLPLTPEQAEACSKLQRREEDATTGTSSSDDDDSEELSTFQRFQQNRKRQKFSNSGTSVKYVDVSKLICAMCNCCERLFSEAKYIMVPHCRGMSPIVFESLLFLKKNLRFWDVKTVAKAMKRAEKEDADDDDLFERDDDEFYN